jgi:hypothetical protein
VFSVDLFDVGVIIISLYQWPTAAVRHRLGYLNRSLHHLLFGHYHPKIHNSIIKSYNNCMSLYLCIRVFIVIRIIYY